MITQVKERPILFTGPMVQAILDGRKSQTRRVIKPQPNLIEGYDHEAQQEAMFWNWFELHPNSEAGHWIEQDFEVIRQRMLKVCPYGQPGDRLWVREAWAIADIYDKDSGNQGQMPFELGQTTRGISIWYKAGGGKAYKSSAPGRWRSPLFMPRAACRILLEITGIRVEQVQSISEEDAKSEGLNPLEGPVGNLTGNWNYRQHFECLWESINAKKFPWASNPWVWVIDFKVVENSK